MTTKNLIIAGIVLAVLSFAAGRYSVDQPTITETADTKQDTTEKVNTNIAVKKVTTIVKEPDGKETTVITEDRNTKKVANDQIDTVQDVSVKEEPAKHGTLNISALAGVNIQTPQQGMVYGASVTKEIIGPISIGIFGFTNGLAGASVGISF